MANNFTDLYLDTLQSTYLSTDTTLTVSDASPLTAPTHLTIFDRKYGNAANAFNSSRAEIVLVTSIATNDLTVTRGIGRTSAIDFDSSGDWSVVQTLSDTDLDDIAFLSGGNTFSGDQVIDNDSSLSAWRVDANPNNADEALGGFTGLWNGTVVTSISMRSGDDTANKDEGEIAIFLRNAGAFSEVGRIKKDGTLHFPAISFDSGTTVLDSSNLVLEDKANVFTADQTVNGAENALTINPSGAGHGGVKLEGGRIGSYASSLVDVLQNTYFNGTDYVLDDTGNDASIVRLINGSINFYHIPATTGTPSTQFLGAIDENEFDLRVPLENNDGIYPVDDRGVIITNDFNNLKFETDIGGSQYFRIEKADGTILFRVYNTGDVFVENGNLAINETDPQAELHITGASPEIMLDENDRGSNNRLWGIGIETEVLKIKSYSDTHVPISTLLSLDRDGNAGIGVTPTEKLDVAGNVQIQQESGNPTLYINKIGGVGFPSIFFQNDGVQLSGIVHDEGNDRLEVRNDSNDAIHILGSGSGNTVDFPLGLSFDGGTNVLSEYEEGGTWTPILVATGTDFDSVSYSSATNGFYTRIGDTVHCHFRMDITSVTKGSASGNVRIGGLPFTADGGSFAVGYGLSIGNSDDFITAPDSGVMFPAYVDQVGLRKNTGTAGLDVADVNSGTNNITGTITYKIA